MKHFKRLQPTPNKQNHILAGKMGLEGLHHCLGKSSSGFSTAKEFIVASTSQTTMACVLGFCMALASAAQAGPPPLWPLA